MTEILTSLHGSKIGLSKDNELVIQDPTSGNNEVMLRPSSLSGLKSYTTTTGVSAGKYATFSKNTLIITLTDVELSLTDNTTDVAYGTTKIAEIPATDGYWLIDASMDLTITKSSAGVNDNWDSDISLATSPANSTNSLGGIEQNIIQSTSVPRAVSGSTRVAVAKNTDFVLNQGNAPLVIARDVNINMLIDDASHNVAATACNMIFNGTVTLSLTEVLASNY